MMQLILVLKDAIRKDPRFTQEESKVGTTTFYYPRFNGAHLSDDRSGGLTSYVGVDDFMVAKIPQDLADYVASVELRDEFNCLQVRLQGHYRFEEAGGTAEAYLRRTYEKDDDDPGQRYVYDADGSLGDADVHDPEYRRVMDIVYDLKIRASSPTAAIKLYRAIRAGTARPVEDWDAPMSDAR